MNKEIIRIEFAEIAKPIIENEKVKRISTIWKTEV